MLIMEDSFDVRERGVAITLLADERARMSLIVGSRVVVPKPDGSLSEITVQGIELFPVCFGDPDRELRTVGLLVSGVDCAAHIPRGSMVRLSTHLAL